jgi:hypothetical protein
MDSSSDCFGCKLNMNCRAISHAALASFHAAGISRAMAATGIRTPKLPPMADAFYN